jgi:RNA polymerase sigma-54 factor
MILNDIAEDIEMDISTISRVTREKYVQTPYGVFELKYFFNDRMATSSGEEVATRTIKSKLREIVDAEDKKKPLSDQALADLLKKEGFPIARRTVQKYREQMNIPVKRMRREVV